MESNLKYVQQGQHDSGANNSQAIKTTINVGSRKSELALIQTNLVIKRLKDFYSNNIINNNHHLQEGQNCQQNQLKPHEQLVFNVVSMTTTGDRILDKPLPAIGTKSLFTGELEKELLEGRVDFVVHSLKDLPTTIPEGLTIGAVMKRDDPDDTIVMKDSLRLKMKPLDLLMGRNPEVSSGGKKLKIGTSSQRRIAMIKRCNPNLECIDIRGNLNTRLAKLDKLDGEYAAIILARAGLDRMNWSDRASCQLNPDNDEGLSDWFYAVGQGAIAVECRSDDDYILDFLSPIVHLDTTYEVIAERSIMKKLEAGCSVPLGVRSTWIQAENDKILKLESIVLSEDGQSSVKADKSLILLNSSSTSQSNTTNVHKMESLTTGINISKSKLLCPGVEENMINCYKLGIEIANKMIDLGCHKLLA